MVENVFLKSANHSKQAELPEVENGLEWQRASNKEDKRLWGLLVEL